MKVRVRALAVCAAVVSGATLAAGAGDLAAAGPPVGTCMPGTEPFAVSEIPPSLAFVDHNANGVVCVFFVPADNPGAAYIIRDDIAKPNL